MVSHDGWLHTGAIQNFTIQYSGNNDDVYIQYVCLHPLIFRVISQESLVICYQAKVKTISFTILLHNIILDLGIYLCVCLFVYIYLFVTEIKRQQVAVEVTHQKQKH